MKKWLIFSVILNISFLIAGVLLVQRLGGFQHLIYKAMNRGLAGVYEHRKNMFELLPEKDSTIIFLGNSITAQCEWAELFQNPNILNRGIPGDATDGILDRLPHILKHNPTKIFLMIGVNDLFFHKTPYILENYGKIVSQIKSNSPHTQLYIQSVLPVNNQVKNTTLSNETIENLNQEIKQIAQRYQLTYIDLYFLFENEKGNLDARFTRDGIHLNGEAYLIWKGAIEKFLNDEG